ncbi:MAG: tripartite tricarboxylate transporter substrate binding protein [Polaromonas sp.]|nr:tripartite tricarboxylate transporter substrate binding protein [Polaromonas sp.]
MQHAKQPFFNRGRRALLALSAGIACAALTTGSALAQAPAWPTKPIRFVVGWPPGGGTDAVARMVAERLSTRLGQNVVIENRAGANAKIGTALAKQAAPDGYTFLFHAEYELPPVTLSAPLGSKYSSFDPLKTLEPAGIVGRGPYILVTSATFQGSTLSDLLAFAKKNPGKLNYGSFGTGSISHLLTELLNLNEGIQTVEIPYQGTAPLLAALTAGQVDFAFVTPTSALPLVKAGRLKGIAVLSPQRLPGLDIPTMAESGKPTFNGGSWYAVLAPAGTPKAIVDRLNAEMRDVVASADLKQAFERVNIVPLSTTPEGMEKTFASELVKRRQLASHLNIDVE